MLQIINSLNYHSLKICINKCSTKSPLIFLSLFSHLYPKVSCPLPHFFFFWDGFQYYFIKSVFLTQNNNNLDGFYSHLYIILVLPLLVVNNGEFIYSYLTFEHVISFSCIITLSKTPGIILERRDEHLQFGHPLKGKDFSISIAHAMLAKGL